MMVSKRLMDSLSLGIGHELEPHKASYPAKAGIQYAAAFAYFTSTVVEYRVTRFRG